MPRLGGRRHARHAGGPARHRHRPGARPRAKAACRAAWCASTAGRPPSQTALGLHVAAVWLTPQLDRISSTAPGGRRRFLDRMVTALHPEHAGDVAAYENAMRQRARLLRKAKATRAGSPRWRTRWPATAWRWRPARRHVSASTWPRDWASAHSRAPAGAGGRDRAWLAPWRRSTPRTAARRGRLPRAMPRPAPRGGPHRSDLPCTTSTATCRRRNAQPASRRRSSWLWCWPMRGWWRCRAVAAAAAAGRDRRPSRRRAPRRAFRRVGGAGRAGLADRHRAPPFSSRSPAARRSCA